MSDDLLTRPGRRVDGDGNSNGLRRTGAALGLVYPWSATRRPACAVGRDRDRDDDEPEVFDDEPRDLVAIFGSPE